MRFDFIGSAYRSQSVNADCQICKNWYLEIVESGQGKSKAALYQRPGLQLTHSLGTTFSLSIVGGVLQANIPFPLEVNSLGSLAKGMSVMIADGAKSEVVTVTAINNGQITFFPSFTATFRFTHGLNALFTYQVPTAGVRGLTTAQGRSFTVSGSTLFEIFAPSASPNTNPLGQILSDGQPVSMASGPTQLLAASEGTLYLYDLKLNTLSTVPSFNKGTGLGVLGAVSQVVYSDGFFLSLIANSNQIQCSNPLDGSTWQGVNFTQVSTFSDNISAIFVDHRLLWVFGPNNIQVYWNSGNFPFPYDIVEGGFIEQGIAAPFSVAKADNSILWLGQDSRGSGIVWRANGYQPVRVSTHAIEYELSTYSTIADAVCYAYQDQGHTFYVMNFPTAQKTWVYDCATQSWSERDFWNAQAGKSMQSRAGFHTFNFGKHLVGDPTTGAIYEQSINFLSDFGNVIRRVRTSPHISNENSRQTHSKLQIDVETGLGPMPPFRGSGPSTIYQLADKNGQLWSLAIADGGILQTQPVTSGQASTVYLNDLSGTTTWQITVSALGIIFPIPTTFISTAPMLIPFITTSSQQGWQLQLKNLGNGIAELLTIPLGIVGRGPQIILSWSDDFGHTYSNDHFLDCGQAGKFRTRVIKNRLGQTRDRVYRVIATDPFPCRLIDAFLFIDNPEDRQPKERYASIARKQA